MSGTVDKTIAEGVMTLRMNRPEKKNALTDVMYNALADAMIAADEDAEVGAVLLTGAGDDFTTGNDIMDFMRISTQGRAAGDMGVARFLRAQIECQTPLIAAVTGLAVGVGATTLFQCDLVYAADNADIRTPFIDLALVPENASSLLAPQIMGHQRAFQMLCLGDPFNAEQALQAGIVNHICTVEDVEQVAFDAARRLAAKPREAMRISRALLRQDPTMVAARSAEESRLFGERLQSDEARAAFTKFMTRKG